MGCFTSGSPANSVALKPGGSVIAFTASSGERPANFTSSTGSRFGFCPGAAAATAAKAGFSL